jgi:DNA-binding CsgD family transcriptional regulator
VLSALLPGLSASVGALARLGNSRRAIALLLDALEDGAVVFDSAGREILARNAAMNALMLGEPERAGLERAVKQAALPAAWTAPAPGTPNSDTRPLSRGWRSQSGMPYRLRAVRLPSGCLSGQEAVLVLVQRLGPAVASPSELMQRFGLTRRESEVAHRLAYGRSDREIAVELRLSTHTVRHHAEAVFVKAGVTSRKALAVHLAAGTGPD